MDTVYYSIPAYITGWLQEHGYQNPWEPMRAFINAWEAILRAEGDFWDYREVDGDGHVYQVHRRSVKPARRVCDEWASLILNEDTIISTEDETCTEWLQAFLHEGAFQTKGQELVSDSMSLGTAAWALWYDMDEKILKVRRYDARMIIPLSWDEDGVFECAFATQTIINGKTYNQLQLHVREGGSYRIRTVCFTNDGKEVPVDGIIADFDTRSPLPPFAIIRPAIKNRYVDFSPYGQSIIAGHEDVLKSVDLAYDAVFNEVDLAKMRVFIADTLLEQATDTKGNRVAIPFGRKDATIYRKIMTAEDTIKEYAPAMRTEEQVRAYRIAVQAMGDECGFGSQYFDIDKSGGIRTAKEVSADNSALMRNVRKHENVVGAAIAQLCRAILHFAREFMGEPLPDEGQVHVNFDDSIIVDTMTEKQQDLAEVAAGVMTKWEYRVKWYGDSEEAAKAAVAAETTDRFSLLG